jgi:ribonuclease-3
MVGSMSSPKIAAEFCIPAGAVYLEAALTHPSHANEMRDGVHNQRLEFLGDAVLELCASEWLFRTFPAADEGELTRRRAQLVNADALADFARSRGVDEALRLGRGAEANGLRQSKNVLADAVEALVACAYLDGGLEAARQACEGIVQHGLDSMDQSDPKTDLQERLQGQRLSAPVYRVVETGGPAHERWFAVEVNVGGVLLGKGVGRSKRTAERAAAAQALAADWAALNARVTGARETSVNMETCGDPSEDDV